MRARINIIDIPLMNYLLSRTADIFLGKDRPEKNGKKISLENTSDEFSDVSRPFVEHPNDLEFSQKALCF